MDEESNRPAYNSCRIKLDFPSIGSSRARLRSTTINVKPVKKKAIGRGAGGERTMPFYGRMMRGPPPRRALSPCFPRANDKIKLRNGRRENNRSHLTIWSGRWDLASAETVRRR